MRTHLGEQAAARHDAYLRAEIHDLRMELNRVNATLREVTSRLDRFDKSTDSGLFAVLRTALNRRG